MGPGSRRDCLDAHFGDYNWRKVMSMGTTLFQKARAAANDIANHTIVHNELTATLPADTVKQWTEEVEAWERWQQEPSSDEPTNPYNHKVELPTQAAVRRRLAEAEADDIASRKDLALDVNVTPSVLISAGLDLEAEHIQNKIPFDKSLAEIEWELRVAQAEEALEGLRHNLQIRCYLFKFKDQNVRGQHANTRAHHAIENVQSKIDTCAEEYRAAQHAIISLGTLLKKVGWKQKYLTLEQGDIREISEAEEGISVGRSLTSWIWRIKGAAEPTENDEVFRDGMGICTRSSSTPLIAVFKLSD
ncbi:hypothetical protein C0992_003230 [Termitomyces sp. T32_za158]|nr:hypothetical protein C0992_003230 [Termitomyces sp. T32_za158]